VPEALQRVLEATGPLILADTGAEEPCAPLLGARLVSGGRVLGLVAVGGRATEYRREEAETLADIAADLGPLIQSLLDTEAKDAQLAQAHKMEALGVLAGGIAHEFNNILQTILGFSSLAREDTADPEHLTANLDRVQRATMRGRDMVQRILQFSRSDEPAAAPLDPVPLTENLVRELKIALPRGIEIEIRLEADCGQVCAAPGVLRQALASLTTNAVQALEATGGRLTVSVRPWSVPADDHRFPPDWCGREVVEFAVADTGPGISEAHRARLFDPFYTTREVGQGSGLGLSVVHGLVTGLGGQVTIECPAAGGTVASIYLPRVYASRPVVIPDPLPAIPAAAATGARHGRILFVDDAPELRDLAMAMLGGAGFEVETAADGLAACERITARPDDFDVMITDQCMPGLGGRELALRVAALRPGLPVILVSGLDELADPSAAGGRLFREVVTKPFSGQSLCLAVQRALGGRPAGDRAGQPPLDSGACSRQNPPGGT
jgi:signal transduction histidine kinase